MTTDMAKAHRSTKPVTLSMMASGKITDPMALVSLEIKTTVHTAAGSLMAKDMAKANLSTKMATLSMKVIGRMT